MAARLSLACVALLLFFSVVRAQAEEEEEEEAASCLAGGAEECGHGADSLLQRHQHREQVDMDAVAQEDAEEEVVRGGIVSLTVPGLAGPAARNATEAVRGGNASLAAPGVAGSAARNTTEAQRWLRSAVWNTTEARSASSQAHRWLRSASWNATVGSAGGGAGGGNATRAGRMAGGAGGGNATLAMPGGSQAPTPAGVAGPPPPAPATPRPADLPASPAPSPTPQCDERLSGRGRNYRGCQTRTRSGETCQSWSAQSPHRHPVTPQSYPHADLVKNYCRNPRSDRTIWCYTASPSKRWDFCDPLGPRKKRPSSRCDEAMHDNGADYRGCQRTTRSGKTCQAWASKSPHDHTWTPQRYPHAGLDANFCRNPSNSSTIWCFTKNASTRWEYCNPNWATGLGPPPKVFWDATWHMAITLLFALLVFAHACSVCS